MGMLRHAAIACAVSMLLVASAGGQNLLVNGDFESGDETGWTRSGRTSWGNGSETWTVAPPNAPTPPGDQYSGQLSCNLGSFGWWQVVPVYTSSTCTLTLDWKAQNCGWIEVMLWTMNYAPQAEDVEAIFGPGDNTKVAFKEEGYTSGWEAANDPAHYWPNGNNGQIVSLGWVVVGLKVGGASGNPAAWFDNIVLTAVPGPCTTQHELTGIDPTTHPNDSNLTLTIQGDYLDLVSAVSLVPAGSFGSVIAGTNLTLEGNGDLTVDFATKNAYVGVYHVVTQQASPCAGRQLRKAFTLTCGLPTTISGLTPDSVVNPDAPLDLLVSGTNLGRLASVALVLGDKTIPGTDAQMVGNDLRAQFAVSCVPGGTYHLTGTTGDGCAPPQPQQPGDDAFLLVKTSPRPGCQWQPWAADWSKLNLLENMYLPTGSYDPTNWDYSFSRDPQVPGPPPGEMTMDTPDGSNHALHWFLAPEPNAVPPFTGGKEGSGGVFQEITVTPGVPLKYSFWWKGASTGGDAWFELLLIDGPFSIWWADKYQESQGGANNPYMVRKRSLSASGILGWQQRTDEDAADVGPYGNRPTTITPSGTTVTVVLKAGRYPGGGMEALFDRIMVWQPGGSNLIVNGEFEDLSEVPECDYDSMFADPCEDNFWRRAAVSIPQCPDPFADADTDGDVDHEDFGIFQTCLTGGGGSVSDECRCFDRPTIWDPTGDGDVDASDLAEFEVCATGPDVAADVDCDNEACCLPNGTCQDLHPALCVYRGGTPQGELGDGTDCSTAGCPRLGACCLGNYPSDTCRDVPESECVALGGSWRGEGTECATAGCETVAEACCFYNHTCYPYPPSRCLSYHATPMGAGTTCGSVTCP